MAAALTLMPWPIVTLTIKLLTLKFVKGAVVGLARYVHRIVSKDHRDRNGEPITGAARVEHIVLRESTAKDNMIFLILMLGNVFFGLQELCLWAWGFYARRFYDEYRMGMPAELEDVNDLVRRVHFRPWSRIWPELGRWLAIASLIYWPLPKKSQTLRWRRTRNPLWIEVRYLRHTYMIRTDRQRERFFNDMMISCNGEGNLRVSAGCASIDIDVDGTERESTSREQ